MGPSAGWWGWCCWLRIPVQPPPASAASLVSLLILLCPGTSFIQGGGQLFSHVRVRWMNTGEALRTAPGSGQELHISEPSRPSGSQAPAQGTHALALCAPLLTAGTQILSQRPAPKLPEPRYPLRQAAWCQVSSQADSPGGQQ